MSIYVKFARYTRKFFRAVRAFYAGAFFGTLFILVAPAARAEWVFTSGTGNYWYQPAAVNRAADQFLGRPPGDTDPNTGSNKGSGPGALVSANGPLRLQRHHALALSWRHAVALHARLDLVTGVRLEYARTRWFIKDGVDVLRDDLTVDLRHLGLTPTLALRTPLPQWGKWRADLSAGLGADVLWTRTRLASALLDVRRTQRFSDTFAFASARVGHAAFPADAAVIGVHWRGAGTVSFRLGVEHRF